MAGGTSTRVVHRPARTVRPLPAAAERQVEAPPNLPDGKAGSPMMAMLPMMGIMGSVVMMTIIRSSQFAVIGALVLVVALTGGVVLLLSQRGKAQRTRRTQRERYLEYLEELREELARQDREHRRAAQILHPPPEALHDLLSSPARLWERRRPDTDFLHLRAGTGLVPVRELPIREHGGSTVLTPPDPFMLNEAHALADRFSTVPDLPLTVPLDRAGNVSVVGEREDVLRLVRALLAQAAVGHAPDDAAIAVACSEERLADWEWVKWLPHTSMSDVSDGPVAARRIATDPSRLASLLSGELRQRASYAAEVRRGLSDRNALRLVPRLLAVSDTHGGTACELPRPDEAVPLTEMGVTVLHLVGERIDEPGDVSLRLTVNGDALTVEDLRGERPLLTYGSVDEMSGAWAEGLARLLAPLRLSAESAAETPLSGPVDHPGMLGLSDASDLDLEKMWRKRDGQSFLRVPIGVTDDGEPLLLDLKESSELGMGPHGLCVGATGSGKSELLRTLVLALLATHPPEDLAMVLVDYKGGATFAPFEGLPHVAGIITNLENDAGLIERVHTSLAGEVKRRQQVLKDAGNIADIGSYAAARAERPELASLPHLFVVIDEFGELLTAKPDFIELFLSIGRIGRSIGVHLLLSSQRIEGGKLKGLDTYLSYRLGLRTFSPDESRTVLDTTDAFHLPPLPGFGYLKVDTSVYERFKAGYVSGPYTGPAERQIDDGPAVWAYPAYNTGEDDGRDRTAATGDQAPAGRPVRAQGPTTLSLMTDRMRNAAPPVPSIWLPPLPRTVTLDSLAGPLEVNKSRGLHLTGCPGGSMSALQVPLGLLDDPERQWQGPWMADLNVAGGHTAVIGGPQSGKTTLLRALALSLALTHTPGDVGIYGLDLVGGGLQPLTGLPHMGGVAGRADRERAVRTVEELHAMLGAREELFRERGIDSVEQLRRLRAQGDLKQLASTDIVLLIDGFGALREDFEELEEGVADLLRRGGGYGIHVVAGMLRWNDIRIATQSTFGTRIELRLNDPAESTVKRKLAETLSPDEPGRALTDSKLFAHAALPRIDGYADADDVGAALEEAVAAVRAAWHGPVAAPVRVLPTRLGAHELPGPRAEPTRLPIGLDQHRLEPTLLDLFSHDQHLLILGDDACGKTNLLRLISHGLTARYRDDELVFGVMDPRRGLRGAVPEPYRGGYAHNSRVASALADGIAKELDKRLPDDTLDPDSSDGGPDFTGPRIVILVDDYDIIASGGQQPLAPFLPYLPSAADIGLHFVMARRASGASRALYEPFLSTLRESGTSTLVMNGDRTEGQLLPGLSPRPLPPGRGLLVRRGSSGPLVQTALAPDTSEQHP
ncbi:type VII secretion protein EccCa [Streptomyces sp. NPDC048172]|uniref:type VII secretion protein EccCa n=1 Tax=Streptomyces sp. NPDC048172 TaxID=3365505 RepID=UPI0037187C88